MPSPWWSRPPRPARSPPGRTWASAPVLLCGGSGGNHVKVAGNLPGAIAVRDSKNPAGLALVFTSGEWHTFLTTVKSGRFD
ncbi:DUF397 domain-containing protein [Streptosporangium oxazolinicum]|uniref:DUF397 domain-containing protein n=1 Tax=Streptosporangium oxazolinicum TaxID=909287 RepID=UPI0031EFFB70